MIEIVADNIVVPISYADEEKLFIDTDQIREDFENFMSELENAEEYE
jgi:hypothetical protein